MAIASAFGLAMAPLISLLYEVIKRGAPWHQLGILHHDRARRGRGGGAEHDIVGTLIITACAAVISVPNGIMAAIYMNEYGRGPLRRALTFFVDVMTGIPSIVAALRLRALRALLRPRDPDGDHGLAHPLRC